MLYLVRLIGSLSLFSPLEQFDVIIGRRFDFFNFFSFSFTISNFFVLLTFLSIIFLFSLNRSYLVPTRLQCLLEEVFLFISNTMLQQTSNLISLIYFPIFFTVFVFILFSNLLGVIPFTFTTTAHLILTFSIALSFNVSFFILGFYWNNFRFLQIFVPDCPFYLLPFLVLVEIFSYLLRSFSLSIRLFANMMAGHTILYILASFSVGFFLMKYYFSLLALFILIFSIFLLELGIAVLQAYVFFVLLCVYLSDVFNLVHK